MSKKRQAGHYLKASATGGESYQTYIPCPLPPSPELDMADLSPSLEQANTALGRLDGLGLMLPNPALLLYMYIRKEAVLSSQIEGTQSSLSDLLLAENSQTPGVPMHDVAEVSCYVSAMDHGMRRLQEFPLCLRLICEIHAKLMDNPRSKNKQPGEFRTSQNWIGGSRPGKARFVPPPPEKLMECLDHLEKFLHNEEIKLSPLIKAALIHAQFETIHPFLDGNGRLGRLLIPLFLHHEGILQKPLLYLSLYFKQNRKTYYNHLQTIRKTGDWESWIKFFLIGIAETAHQATQIAQEIIHLFNEDRTSIEKSDQSTAATLTIFCYLQQHPISNTTSMRHQSGLSQPSVMRALHALESLHIVEEITGKQRHKIFVYKSYLDILNED